MLITNVTDNTRQFNIITINPIPYCNISFFFPGCIGKAVSQKVIRERMNKLNVQVDNLCQFLPQDKVCSFAALSSSELLRETEKAVGSEEMLARHDELIRLRNDSKALQRACAEHADHLANLMKANESLERDVLRFRYCYCLVVCLIVLSLCITLTFTYAFEM